MPIAWHLLGLAVPAGQAVRDHQRGQAERDQRGDLVTGREAERGIRADLVDGAGEHAAGAGHRVLHLAPGPDDLQYRSSDLVRVAVVRLAQLAEGRGVQVQPGNRDPHLVRPDRGPRVQPPGSLRQHAGRFQHPVQAERRASCAGLAVQPGPGKHGSLAGLWSAAVVRIEPRSGHRWVLPVGQSRDHPAGARLASYRAV